MGRGYFHLLWILRSVGTRRRGEYPLPDEEVAHGVRRGFDEGVVGTRVGAVGIVVWILRGVVRGWEDECGFGVAAVHVIFFEGGSIV